MLCVAVFCTFAMLLHKLCKHIYIICWLVLLWMMHHDDFWRNWRIIWPVLKHGPRSLKYVQVKDTCVVGKKKMIVDIIALTANFSFVRNLRLSMCFRTRKMVNYAWGEKSQGKLWWMLAALLTCKSFVILGYRGERPIEPSSSWFPLKFPSG